MTAFDAFDGVSWQEAPLTLTTCLLEKERGSCWMKVQERQQATVFAENEGHKFKIATSFGSLVPAPPHLVRFRVGRVDQANFFAWGQDRILRMAQRKTPSGIIVETESRTVDPRLLADVQFPFAASTELPQSVAVPTTLHPEVRKLAHRWAEGKPRGWAQIAAVVDHLRAEYVHDRSAHVPEDCTDPLGAFPASRQPWPRLPVRLGRRRSAPRPRLPDAAGERLLRRSRTLRSVDPTHAGGQGRLALLGRGPAALRATGWCSSRRPVTKSWGRTCRGRNGLLAALVAVGWWLWKHGLAVGLCLAGVAFVWWKRLELFDALRRHRLPSFPRPVLAAAACGVSFGCWSGGGAGPVARVRPRKPRPPGYAPCWPCDPIWRTTTSSN